MYIDSHLNIHNQSISINLFIDLSQSPYIYLFIFLSI